MIKVSVKNLQTVKSDLKREIAKLTTNKRVLVGIHESAGAHESSDLTNAQVGAYNEYGTEHIPARPWLNPGVASGDEEYINIIEKAVQSGKPVDFALQQIGVVAVAKVQKYMTELRTPPNAPSTVKRKGSSNPLINSGELKNSVTSSITSEPINEGI